MDWFTPLVLYVLIWWTLLFAVLPFGTQPASGADAASGWRGAPVRPHMGRKLLATTLLSLVVWGLALALIRSSWFSLRPGGFFG